MSLENINKTLADVLQHLSQVAADDEVRLHVQRSLSQPGVELLAGEGDEYLFKMPPGVREDFAEFRFFFMGRLLDVRRIGMYSSEYSAIAFPGELALHRRSMEDRFAALMVTTDEGRGWNSHVPWDELNEAQKAVCKPRFIEDNIRQFVI